MSKRLRWGFGASVGLLAVALAGCSPAAQSGECSAATPCPRGSTCELDTSVCMPLELDTSATETPSPASFSGKIVPMFRGRVCTVREVQAGTTFPVSLEPCFHPCLSVRSFKHKHSWECVGSNCEAFSTMWVEADGEGCPEDAFGQFDESQCAYDNPVELMINATLADGSPVEGQMEIEVPFLSNEDATAIAADEDDTDLIKDRIEQYPSDPGRVAFGERIRLLRNGPAAPASCQSGECECTSVGF